MRVRRSFAASISLFMVAGLLFAPAVRAQTGADVGVRGIQPTTVPATDSNFELRFVVKNHGPASASNVYLSIGSPSHMPIQDVRIEGAANPCGSYCQIGDIPFGESKTVVVTARRDAGNSGRFYGSLGSSQDPLGSNNYAEIIVQADPDVAADMSFSLSSTPTTVEVDDEYVLTAKTKNLGPHAAKNVSFQLDLQGDFVSLDNPSCGQYGAYRVTCYFGDVPLGEERSVKITLERARAQEVADLGHVSSALDLKPANDAARVTFGADPSRSADLQLSDSDPGAPEVGQEFDYTLTVKNLGPW